MSLYKQTDNECVSDHGRDTWRLWEVQASKRRKMLDDPETIIYIKGVQVNVKNAAII